MVDKTTFKNVSTTKEQITGKLKNNRDGTFSEVVSASSGGLTIAATPNTDIPIGTPVRAIHCNVSGTYSVKFRGDAGFTSLVLTAGGYYPYDVIQVAVAPSVSTFTLIG